jgi:teichuronic acid biosynthesis glycosyltransferase TuaC
MKSRNLLVLAPAFPDRLNRNIEGIFVKEQVKYLKEYFAEVYVIAPHTIWNKYLLKKHCENYTWDNVHIYYPELVNFPLPYVPDHMKKAWLIKETRDIRKLISSEKMAFDLIHAHYTWYPGAVALSLKKEFSVPVVITEHTSTTLYKALQRKDPYFLKTWSHCDAVIRVNSRDLSKIKSFNKNTFFIPNGFDEERLYLLDKEESRMRLAMAVDIPLDKNAVIIFSLGFLTEVKGHRYLIKAIDEILQERKDVLCLIGGPGPLKRKLQIQIDDAHLRNHVKLMDFVNDEELVLLMNACDIFVLPSLSESFGIVQLEAMACGRPVVATRNGGSEEIVISEDYGYLAEAGNVSQLAKTIQFAMERNWDERKIKEYACGFSWKNIARKIVSVYENVEERATSGA